MSEIVRIDGSRGEGGGQVLRTSLGLSLVTGRPLVIERIRAGRRKPGLLRQHLTCVRAAQALGAAEVIGAELGATRLEFRPQALLGGRHEFAIGGAGSTILVFQCVLPALLAAREPVTLVVEGGTHNPLAPTFDYLARVVLPVLREAGARIEARLERPGFFPAGGGRVVFEVEPGEDLRPIRREVVGPIVERRARVLVAKLRDHVGRREEEVLQRELGWRPHEIERCPVEDSAGPGNVVILEVSDGAAREQVTSFGERGLSAEDVARGAAREMAAFIESEVPVGEFLADQLLLPMALAGGGSFVCSRPSLHARTNAEVIERFLPLRFRFESLDGDRCRVSLGE
ncbi:MAG: RNA 3'-terminal phosphate cyclase [Planctomycetota bacterium]